jgi:hypothetical protein
MRFIVLSLNVSSLSASGGITGLALVGQIAPAAGYFPPAINH